MEVKYYVCNHCGNIIEMLKDQGVPVMCCGEAMHELKAGVTDAAVEKHVDRKSTRLNSSHASKSRMPSSA